MDNKLQKAFNRAKEVHLSKDEVTGVVVGYRHKDGKLTDELCIGIRVKEKKPLSELKKSEILPKTILGVRTDIVEANPKGLDQRFPTLIGGISIGRESEMAAGTLGCIVYDKSNAYALTNAHVVIYGSIKSSEEYILQPAYGAGGVKNTDRIGAVYKAYANTRGDHALIKLDNTLRDIGTTIDVSNEEITAARDPQIDDVVEKVGRTTGRTQGKVVAIGTFIEDISDSGLGSVQIDGFEIVPLVNPNELIGGPGDSGSLIYSPGKRTAVGVLCAGVFSPTMIFCSFVTNALSDFGVSFTKELVAVKTPDDAEEQVVYNFVNAGWVGADPQTYTFDMIFKDDLENVFLYTDSYYSGLLWGKLSTESEFMPIGGFSHFPTCILGDVEKNVQVTIDIQIIPSFTTAGEQNIPVKISYGELVKNEGMLDEGFFWRNYYSRPEPWGDDYYVGWTEDMS
jgi:hypothetical protein